MKILILFIVSLLVVTCGGNSTPTPVQKAPQTVPKTNYIVTLSTQEMIWAEGKIKNFLAKRGCSYAISELEAYGSFSRDTQTGIIKVGLVDMPSNYELFWLVDPNTGAVRYYDYALC